MWTRNYSKTYQGINKEDIWRIWTRVNKWPEWHDDLVYCEMSGDFVLGNHFMLKPKGAPAFKIVLTEIDPGHSFTDCTSFFGAKMYDTHSMIETSDGLTIMNKIVVMGPLKWLWIKLVAQDVANSMAEQMESLVTRATAGNV